MASGQSTPTPRYCLQQKKFTECDKYELWDVCLSLSGHVAVSGYNKKTYSTFIDVYSGSTFDGRDELNLFFSMKYKKYVSDQRCYLARRIAFEEPCCDNIVTCLGFQLHVIHVYKQRIVKTRSLNGEAICLSVIGRQIYIGFYQSQDLSVYDGRDLHKVTSITLNGIDPDDFPYSMRVSKDIIHIATWKGRSLLFQEKTNSILSYVKIPASTSAYVHCITVDISLGVIAAVWSNWDNVGKEEHWKVVFFSLGEYFPFLTVDVECGVSIIKLSDRANKILMGNYRTGDVKMYDMEELFTFNHLKKHLQLTLNRDNCVRLIAFFGLSSDLVNAIGQSEKPTENLFRTLEERGLINSYDVEALSKACLHLEITASCYVMDIYRRTRLRASLYGKFLASLSAHLTGSLPEQLCHYFNISKEEKYTITSSKNPGLSLLIALGERAVIGPSDVKALAQVLKEFRLVQAEAKIHQYHSLLEEEKNWIKEDMAHKLEGKKEKLIKCLQTKIKSWYETMSPVPSKKSCKWKSTDLYVGCGLLLTDSKSKRSLINIDEQCKLKYTELFSHDKLISEKRIIIEGDPGSGKTMLVSQLAYEWSQGKITGVDILMLLPLKCVGKKTLVQSLHEFYIPQHEDISYTDIEEIITDQRIKCCIVLDGLEEYNGRNNPSEVMEVISKTKYPSCKVIVTSRSDYRQDLPCCPLLKLGKFGEAEKNDYLEKVFPGNIQKQTAIKYIIEDNLFTLDLCSVPVLFALIVHNMEVLEIVQSSHLDRVTPFMRNMVETLSSPFISEVEIPSFHSEPPTRGKGSIEELAYNGLCRGFQQVSWQKDFIERTVPNSTQWLNSGILAVDDINVEMFSKNDRCPRLPLKLRLGQAVAYNLAGETSEFKKGISDLSSNTPEYLQPGSKVANADQGPASSTMSEADSSIFNYFRKPSEFDKRLTGKRKMRKLPSVSDEKVEPKSEPTMQSADQSESEAASPQQSDKTQVTFLEPEAEDNDLKTDDTRSNSKNVTLQVKFLHKIIQEWFAARYFARQVSDLQQSDAQQRFMNESLPLINPADLHYVLRFSCGLHPSCSHLIIKHLLNKYHLGENSVPDYIMNCIFLCFLEYYGDIGTEILDVVSAVCKKHITIRSDDSRLLQHAKVYMLKMASDCGIAVEGIYLEDLVISAANATLRFNSDVTMGAIDTVRVIEISRWDQKLKDEDYRNLVKYIANSTHLENALLNFPAQPPTTLEKESLTQMQVGIKTVTWKIGTRLRQTLNTTTGEWVLDGDYDMPLTPVNSGDSHTHNDITVLRTQKSISNDGGTLRIPVTGVVLEIPSNAFQEKTFQKTIEMRLLDNRDLWEHSTSFSFNCTVSVEILPNHLKLKQPAVLTLPHCVQLTKETKYGAEVFISHHEKGEKPRWEKLSPSTCELTEKACLITLNEFCWVKCVIDDRVVEAKHLQVYTASKRISAVDNITKIEVGYYPDLDGAGKLLRLNRNWIVTEKRPFLFLKEGGAPLQIMFREIAPPVWKYCLPNDNPKTISFQTIASSTECSCPFILQKQDEGSSYCIFKVSQASEYIELTSPLEVDQTHLEDSVFEESQRQPSCPQISYNTFAESRGAIGGTMKDKGKHDERPTSVTPGPVDIYKSMKRCTFDDCNQEGAPAVNSPQYGLLPFREAYTPPSHFPVVQHYEHTQNVYFNREIDNSCFQIEDNNAYQHGLSLRYSVLQKIAMKLDEEDPLGHDWKQLADELGFSMEEISAIERRRQPTFTVIQSAVKKGTLTSSNHLKMLLEKIQRFDAAALISD